MLKKKLFWDILYKWKSKPNIWDYSLAHLNPLFSLAQAEKLPSQEAIEKLLSEQKVTGISDQRNRSLLGFTRHVGP